MDQCFMFHLQNNPPRNGFSPTEQTTKEVTGLKRLYSESQIPDSKAVIPKGHRQFPTDILIF